MSDNYQFNINGRDNTRRAFMSVQRSLTRMRSLVNSSVVSVGALAGGAALGALVASSLRTQDALAKTADRINATTEGLASLHHLAVLNGSSTENMNKGLEKMTRSVGEAARGIGTAKNALAELNLDADELAGMNAEEQYQRISTAIAGVEDASLQASFAADIFGRSGVELLNTIRQGEEGMRAAREEAEILGVAVSRIDAAKAEMANDSIFRARQAIAGMGNQITNHVGPIIGALVDQFTDATKEAGGMGEVVKNAFSVGVDIVGVFANGIHGLKVIFKGVELAVFGLGAITTMVANGAIELFAELGNTINTVLMAPIKKYLEIAGTFSDTAAEASREFNAIYESMTTMEAPQGLQDAMDSMIAGTANVRDELHDLLMEELPSDVLRGKVDEILAAAEIRAQEIAANAAATAGVPNDDTGESDIDTFDSDVERLITQAEDRRIILQEQYNADLALLEQAKERERITIDQYERMKHNIERTYADRKKQLEQRDAKDRLNTVMSSTTQMFGAFANSSKKMFKMQKAASLAQAMVRLPSAIMESFNNAGGYPWGLVPAAAMALEGASQIASIKSTNLGGGGTVRTPSGGGGSVSTPSLPSMKSPDFGSQFREEKEAPQKQINFHIKNFQGNDAKKLFDEFKTMIKESDEVLIEGGTRQAMELAG